MIGLVVNLKLFVSHSLHAGHIDLVAGVEDAHLPEDTGHVAHLAHVILHQVLDPLFETVIEFEGVTSLSLLESALQNTD